MATRHGTKAQLAGDPGFAMVQHVRAKTWTAPAAGAHESGRIGYEVDTRCKLAAYDAGFFGPRRAVAFGIRVDLSGASRPQHPRHTATGSRAPGGVRSLVERCACGGRTAPLRGWSRRRAERSEE